MKVLIPMVHNNSKLDKAGEVAGALFEVGKKTILEYVVEKIAEVDHASFVFVINENDIRAFHIDNVLRQVVPDCEIVVAKGKTQGAACSCLLAIENVNINEPLLICGIDKYCDVDINEVISYFREGSYDAGVIVFDDVNPKWSYILVDNDLVIEAAEKNPISRKACAGIYYFDKGGSFFDAAMQMIKKNNSVNEQYYIAPSMNEMILKNMRIGYYEIDKDKFYTLSSEKSICNFEDFLGGGDKS